MKKVSDKFLAESAYIDFNHPLVVEKYNDLLEENQSKEEYTRLAFEFVRDEIKHSVDHNIDKVTVKASDVLLYKTSLCFGKSHLLAALLRINNIPAALCYQRLKMANGHFGLHGLNAVYLKKHGWFLLDARGNNDSVSTEFNPPEDALAFPAKESEEYTDDYKYAAPHEYLIQELEGSGSIQEFLEHIPDDY